MQGMGYEKSCERCGGAVSVHRDWDKPPRFCKPCKATEQAKWYTVSCQVCHRDIKAHKDWEQPPRYCKECKEAHPAQHKRCAHCNDSFEITANTILACRVQGWDLPSKCPDCRELFKHKPFTTRRMQNAGGQWVHRTYNSRGDLISESTETTGIFGGEELRHRSHTGKTTGTTHQRSDLSGNRVNTTRDVGGDVKSVSRERTGPLGDSFRESTSRSGATHRTRQEGIGPGKPTKTR